MKNILMLICIGFFSISGINAQTIAVRTVNSQDSTSLFVGLKDSLKPAVYIDGTKYDYKILDLIDPEKIESINVLKGEEAVKEYNAPNGAILITSKNADKNNDDVTKIRIRGKNSIDSESPMVIIDGKEASQVELSKISPSRIKSINIFKDKMAIEKYKAPNGVIVVETKNSKDE